MKRSIIRTAVLLAAIGLLLTLQPVAAQQRGDDANRASANGEVSGTIDGVGVKITYGRPKVKGRTIWGGLVPYNRVWRTGADEASTITFNKNVKVQGETLDAGTYALFTIPGDDEWTIIFNKMPNQWGSFNYKQSEDALRVTAEPSKGSHVEELTFMIDGSDVVLAWETVKVPFSIEAG